MSCSCSYRRPLAGEGDMVWGWHAHRSKCFSEGVLLTSAGRERGWLWMGGGRWPKPTAQALSEALGQVLCRHGTLYFLLSEWNSAFRCLRTWTLTGIRLRPQNTVLEACMATRGPWRSQVASLGAPHAQFTRPLQLPAVPPVSSVCARALPSAPGPGSCTRCCHTVADCGVSSSP